MRPNDSALQLRPAGASGATEQRPKPDVNNSNELTLSQSKGRCTKGCSASCKRLLGGGVSQLLAHRPNLAGEIFIASLGSRCLLIEPSNKHPVQYGSNVFSAVCMSELRNDRVSLRRIFVGRSTHRYQAYGIMSSNEVSDGHFQCFVSSSRISLRHGNLGPPPNDSAFHLRGNGHARPWARP
jgi:hypothetical protein